MAPGQRAPATGSLNLEQAGHLHGRCQEDGVEYFFPWMPRKLAAFRQRSHQLREAEHLIEISFEPVPGQG